MGEAGLVGCTDILNSDVIMGSLQATQICTKKQVLVILLICCQLIIYTIKECNKIPSLIKNQNKIINLILCKTEFSEKYFV